MGKPRMIILIRHAQSEGNKNREIHQMIPDHRVKLTEEGRSQAEAAGHRLRDLLKPDDTLQFYTSPYRRTRETTEGILRTLTASNPDDGAPSPFSRHAIKVYEEPRIREQDFGNFQPCSSEMERMWQERADYGHFFYRIPDGESAADAYDRISGFNESMWRSFSEPDFPSVCVLVTHGLMTRVFLMKWYHWSVEYFEDLRNINHCEFIVMNKNPDNQKYILESKLRTWSELKRARAEEQQQQQAAQAQAASAHKDQLRQTLPDPQRRNTLSQFLPKRQNSVNQPSPPARKWGGCVAGCDHHHDHYPRRSQRKPSTEPSSAAVEKPASNETEDAPIASQEAPVDAVPVDPTTGTVASPDSATSPSAQLPLRPSKTPASMYLGLSPGPGRDGGGTESGAATPMEGFSDESDYFDSSQRLPSRSSQAGGSGGGDGDGSGGVKSSSLANALKRKPRRKPTEEDLERWATESGMGTGVRADALGDEPSDVSEEDEEAAEGVSGEQKTELDKAEERDKSLRGSVY